MIFHRGTAWRRAIGLAGLTCVAAMAFATTENYVYDNVNLDVPDDDPLGVVDSRTISGSAIRNITDVNVGLRVGGPSIPSGWNGDLYAALTFNNTTVVLVNRPGRTASSSVGYSDDGLNIRLSDQAANGDVHLYQLVTGVLPANTPLDGEWQPDGRTASPTSVTDASPRNTSLANFNGLNANGVWQLAVQDRAGFDSHQLTGWSIRLTGQNGATQTITYTGAPTAIPDGSAAGITSQLVVSGSNITNIVDVDVDLFIEAVPEFDFAWIGDIKAVLKHSTGTAVLLNRVGRQAGTPTSSTGGYSDDGFDVTLDDEAAEDIHNYRVVLNGSHTAGLPTGTPVTGAWQPDGRPESSFTVTDTSPRTALLNVFDGTTVGGPWTIKVADYDSGATHTLVSWRVIVTNNSGTQTFDSGPLNLPIPDDDPAGAVHVMNPAGSGGPVTDVNIELVISGTWNGDLAAEVTHGGRRAVLLNRVGVHGTPSRLAGYDDFGVDITLDDQAANGDVHNYQSVIGLPAGGVLTGVWQPDGRDVDGDLALATDPRTALLSSFNGLDANGEWTLLVSDHALGDEHTLYRWTLNITGTGAASIPGDTDNSGCVDDADLTNMILDFGAAGGSSSGFAGTDVNNDGIVDDADLTDLILSFGNGC